MERRRGRGEERSREKEIRGVKGMGEVRRRG